MNKTELITKLEQISAELDSIPGDSSLSSAPHDIMIIRRNIDNLIVELEENKITDEVEED